MKIVLGTLARTGIEALLGSDIAAGVRTALRHYTQRREPTLDSRALARFCHEQSQTADSGHGFELALDPEIEQALEIRARVWDGVSVEQLAAHAVLVYLADIDRASGHATRPPAAVLTVP